MVVCVVLSLVYFFVLSGPSACRFSPWLSPMGGDRAALLVLTFLGHPARTIVVGHNDRNNDTITSVEIHGVSSNVMWVVLVGRNSRNVFCHCRRRGRA